MKKLVLSIVLVLVASVSFGQDVKMPKMSGVSGVDALAKKAISTYEESQSITAEINAIKIVDGADGVKSILGVDGAGMTPKDALTKLKGLSSRVTDQGDSLKELVKLKESAGKAVKTAKPLKKAKAAKTVKGAVAVEKALIDATKEQLQAITSKIGVVNGLLGN